MSEHTPSATPGDDASDVRPPHADAPNNPSKDEPSSFAKASEDKSGNDLMDLIRQRMDEPDSAEATSGRPEETKQDAPETAAPGLAEVSHNAPAFAEATADKAAPDADNFFAALREAAKGVQVPAKPAGTDDDPLALGKLAVPRVTTPEPEEPVVEEPSEDRKGPKGPTSASEDRDAEQAPRKGRDKSSEDRKGRRRSRRDRKKRNGDAEDTPARDDWTDIGGPTDDVSTDDAMLSGTTFEQSAPKPKRSFVQVEPGEPLDLPTPDPKLQDKLTTSMQNLGPAVVVRYGEMRHTGLFEHSLEVPPAPGTIVVIRSERGVELGKVLTRVAVPDPSETPAEPVAEDAPAQVFDIDSAQNSQGETPVASEAAAEAQVPAEPPAEQAPEQSGAAADVPEAPEPTSEEPTDESTESGCGGGCGNGGGGCGGGCGGPTRKYGWIDRDQLIEFLATNGENFPFQRSGRVLRVANTQDKADDKALRDRVGGQLSSCREQIRELKLPMRMVSVENLLGGERVIFYFTSEDRVDFRDLVKRLTTKFKTRVELRQVGARDEARIKGDYERCGQRCCCQEFIKNLQPVSMRMAKLQKATLDPTKISGRCSRLMCCLRYEDACYSELKKNLPHKNTWVRTETMIGRVVGSEVLAQMVKVRLPDGSPEVFAIEEIIERNCDEPEIQERSDRRGRRDAPRDRSNMPRLRDAVAEPEQTPSDDELGTRASEASGPSDGVANEGDKSEGAPRKRRRRGGRRRRKKNTNPDTQNHAGDSTPTGDGPNEG